MESKQEYITIDEDGWLDLPIAKEYKIVQKSINEFLLKNLNKKFAKNINQEINRLVEILVKHGNVIEDVVLKTAILYFFVKKTGFNIDELAKTYSKPVINGITVLIGNLSKPQNDYLNSVFSNNNYAYLGKIKLAEYIIKLESYKQDSSVIQQNKLAEIDQVILNYAGHTHKNLMQLLIKSRNSL